MEFKERIGRKITHMLLAVSLVMSGIFIFPTAAHAAGWLGHEKALSLGTTVTDSIKSGDYRGLTEGKGNRPEGVNTYWHIYKFSMPKDGLLNLYIESASQGYLSYSHWQSLNYFNGFMILSTSNPDDIVWRCMYKENEISSNYSPSRAMYYGSTEIALEQGEYYFAVRQYNTNDSPYYLTLSYKEPVINVTSISLSPSSLTMEIGEQNTLIPTVLPNNATDKTVLWKSTDPAVATVENGEVKALSLGNTSIVASSADGEITAICPVTVKCTHTYTTSTVPATMGGDGYTARTCTKCGAETKNWISAIADVELSETSYLYDGVQHKPAITVRDEDGNTLEVGRDYTVSYPANSHHIGTHTVTIDFIGNYEGTVSRTFTVSPVSVDSVSLDLSNLTLKTGTQQTIKATVLPANATEKGISWTSSNPAVATVENGVVKGVSAGTATITAVTVDGKRTASCEVTVICSHTYHVALTPATRSSNGSLLEECTKCGDIKRNLRIYAVGAISLSKTSYIYSGKTRTPSVTVKDVSGKTLRKSTDYQVSYTGNRKDVGVHTVTVKFKGNYKGSATKKYTIYPKSTKIARITPKKRGFTVVWEKQAAQTTGYEIAYSTDRKFRKRDTRIVSVNKNRVGKKTISKLRREQKYYVRIRAYKNVKVNGVGTKLYSSWSKAKTVTTKK